MGTMVYAFININLVLYIKQTHANTEYRFCLQKYSLYLILFCPVLFVCWNACKEINVRIRSNFPKLEFILVTVD